MAKYREKIEPEIIEAIEWTGKNLEEVKAFLRDCFVEVDSDGRLWFTRYKGDIFEDWLTPEDYILYVDEYGDFNCQGKEDFLEDWELMEE